MLAQVSDVKDLRQIQAQNKWLCSDGYEDGFYVVSDKEDIG